MTPLKSFSVQNHPAHPASLLNRGYAEILSWVAMRIHGYHRRVRNCANEFIAAELGFSAQHVTRALTSVILRAAWARPQVTFRVLTFCSQAPAP
jgi:hypothetical protein